jgi:HEPN domain-containing protein
MAVTQKEEKEEDLLKEQCGDDTEFYAFLCHTLYVDPTTAISKKDLAILVDEAEESFTNGNYGDALRKYQQAVSKAIFEATQKSGEKGRYIKVIQDLVLKTVVVIEKVKEKAEKDGLAERAHYLDKEIGNYEFLSKRIEDVVRIASLYYNDRLEKLGEIEKQAAAKRESYERRETTKTIKKAKEKTTKNHEMAAAGNVN